LLAWASAVKPVLGNDVIPAGAPQAIARAANSANCFFIRTCFKIYKKLNFTDLFFLSSSFLPLFHRPSSKKSIKSFNYSLNDFTCEARYFLQAKALA